MNLRRGTPVKKSYAKRAGATGKSATIAAGRFKDKIDDADVEQLIKRYGSPLFVFSQRTILNTYASARRAFSTRYPSAHFAWSYKTNYLRAVCKTFHRLGSWAEVVSEFEYGLARSLGVEGNHIIYNGPCKSSASLRKAAQEEAIVNIDSFDEIAEIESVAEELRRLVDIGIRVNMSIKGNSTWDRFGMNIESGEAYHAIERALAGKKLRPIALHAHIGTFILETDYYRQAVIKMIELAKLLKQDFGIRLKYIDLGGGFASKSKLKGAQIPTDRTAPDFDEYADAICSPLLEGFGKSELPTLLLETGRALIDEAGFLIATVVAARQFSSGARALVLDAGTNLMFTSFCYDFEIMPASDKGKFAELHNIYGPLCMQSDVIGDGIRIPRLEKGDRVVIHPVGAYNTTQWTQFSHLRPNVVMIGNDGQVEIIREAETADYVMKLDRMPKNMA
jgi:diaminopimelate decarboxylase